MFMEIKILVKDNTEMFLWFTQLNRATIQLNRNIIIYIRFIRKINFISLFIGIWIEFRPEYTIFWKNEDIKSFCGS